MSSSAKHIGPSESGHPVFHQLPNVKDIKDLCIATLVDFCLRPQPLKSRPDAVQQIELPVSPEQMAAFGATSGLSERPAIGREADIRKVIRERIIASRDSYPFQLKGKGAPIGAPFKLLLNKGLSNIDIGNLFDSSSASIIFRDPIGGALRLVVREDQRIRTPRRPIRVRQ